MKKLMKKGKSGFTLVELVIVIAILAIVAAIAIPTAANVIGNANKAADESNAQAIEMAIKTYQAEVTTFSSNQSPLVTKEDTNISGGDKKVSTLLGVYGVSVDLDHLRQSGNNYYYNSTSGKVTVASTAPAGQVELTSTITFKIDKTSGAMTIPEP